MKKIDFEDAQSGAVCVLQKAAWNWIKPESH